MPGIYDQAVIYQVQQANDIVDIIGEHVSLKKKGREMVGLCPFHHDHRPSMNVSPAKQIFKCFACGAGGDVFKFTQMRENLTFPQAIERLAERAGIKLAPIKRGPTQQKSQSDDIDPNRLAKVNAWAADYFQKSLADEGKGRQAREYLAQRGISEESISKWRIGLAVNSTDGLLKAARIRKIPSDLLKQSGLITGLNQDKFVNRLMFTITDVTGRVLGFGGRTLDETGAKYVNSPTTVLFDKSNCLYGLEQARHSIVSSETAVIVEGYTDVIMAHQLGCSNVVASLGTSFTSGHGRIIRRYARKVVLVFDSDVAGIEAANRALEVCLANRIDIKLATVPEGKDPCDFLLAAGKDKFQQVLDNAVDVFESKWGRLQKTFGSDNTLAGRKAAIDEYLQTVATGLWAGKLTPIETGLLVNRIAGIVGLDNKQISKELTQRITRVRNAERNEAQEQRSPSMDLGGSLVASAQREVLEVLLNEPTLFDVVQKTISTGDFTVPALKQVATVLFESLQADPNATIRTILASVESEQLGNTLVAIQMAGEDKGNFDTRLRDALSIIERHKYRGHKPRIDEIEDHKQFLQRVSESTGKENPHSIGML